MQELDYSIDDLHEDNIRLVEILTVMNKKLDALFHDVPSYEEVKVDQKAIPRSGNLRRRLEIAEYRKARQIPEAS